VSEAHTVFTKDDTGDGDSLDAVRSSPLLKRKRVRFVVGPTQRTLLENDFAEAIDLAYLDGPHAYPFPDLEYWAVYPHLRQGALLVVDDVQIPTIHNLYRFLRADAMWELLDVIDDTAFFARTAAPAIHPFGEGHWMQGINQRRETSHYPVRARIRRTIADQAPEPLLRCARRLRGSDG
jgi:hypothetical protein